MSKMLYTREHEWLRDVGDGTAIVGITDFAQQQLGDLVFVELPEVGKSLAKGEAAGAVESVKSASDIYFPVSGTVVETNALIVDDPATVNQDPQGAGWFFKMKLTDAGQLSGLMDEAAYLSYVASLA